MTRQEAIKILKEYSQYAQYAYGIYHNEQKDEEAFDMAIEAMSERTGEWIWSDEDMSWKCGNCGCVFEEIDWKPEYNYCPNCGADMRGDIG